MQSSSKCQVTVSIADDHGRSDRRVDGVNGSCKGENLGSVSGGDERCSRRKLNCENQGISCSHDGHSGSQSKEQITRSSKLVAVEVSASSSSSSSGYIHSQSEDHPAETSSHIALRPDEDGPVSAQERGESRVDGRDDAENIIPMSGSILVEGDPVERVNNRQHLESTNVGSYTSTKRAQASNRQWPRWTVSHMTSLSTMEKVMNYYRALDLADNLSDKDLRSFLEAQVCKEKAGLSETTITNRLRTKLHISAKEGEQDSCSICMIEYKDADEIASLYYCSHEYHAGCIKEWLLKNNLCPMCRALAVIPEDYPCWDGDVRLHQAFFVHLNFAAS